MSLSTMVTSTKYLLRSDVPFKSLSNLDPTVDPFLGLLLLPPDAAGLSGLSSKPSPRFSSHPARCTTSSVFLPAGPVVDDDAIADGWVEGDRGVEGGVHTTRRSDFFVHLTTRSGQKSCWLLDYRIRSCCCSAPDSSGISKFFLYLDLYHCVECPAAACLRQRAKLRLTSERTRIFMSI